MSKVNRNDMCNVCFVVLFEVKEFLNFLLK